MTDKVKIAIDAMGGENTPRKIIDGIEISLKSNKENYFLIYGKQKLIEKDILRNKLVKENCEVINVEDSILDDESPLVAAKKGNATSMWQSIESQKKNNADITLSAGNTGALLVISKLILRTITGIPKPALAALWPNNKNMSLVLDLGANIECDEKNLIDFANMGSALFKSLFANEKPRVAFLNVGLEEAKGTNIIKKASSIIKESGTSNFDFCGNIEGNQIMNGDIDVIVTDGFTGNIALKTAEGTANFITKNFKESLNIFSILFSYNSLKRFKKKLDPRKYNGAIFLGLQGPVVKSHGATDAVGFSYSIETCNKIVKSGLIEKIQSHLN